MLAQSTYFEVIHPKLRGVFSWVATLTNQPIWMNNLKSSQVFLTTVYCLVLHSSRL